MSPNNACHPEIMMDVPAMARDVLKQIPLVGDLRFEGLERIASADASVRWIEDV